MTLENPTKRSLGCEEETGPGDPATLGVFAPGPSHWPFSPVTLLPGVGGTEGGVEWQRSWFSRSSDRLSRMLRKFTASAAFVSTGMIWEL